MDTNDTNSSATDVPEQVGNLVRSALGSWGRTLRLCVIAATGVALWAGVQIVTDLVEERPSSVCVTSSRG